MTHKQSPRFRSPYNYDTDAASLASGLFCPGPGRTQQQFKDETDINTIAKNFGLTGLLPLSARQPTYQDFSSVVDYKTAMDALRSAEANFLNLPSGIRSFFENNPQNLLEFVNNPANAQKGDEIGLWKLFKEPQTASTTPAGTPVPTGSQNAS